jgi:hypothetical protein
LLVCRVARLLAETVFLWIGLLDCRVATLLAKTDFWDWVIGLRRRYASRKDEVPWNGGKVKIPLALVARGNGVLQESVTRTYLSRLKMSCVDALAWESIAVPAFCKI